jgi:hypothetical protein
LLTRKYWLDLFTGETWEEFLKYGANESGFRNNMDKYCSKVQPGDYFICFMTGISRFIAVLEVKSPSFQSQTQIWKRELFPCRFKVELKIKLEPLNGVPAKELIGKISILSNLKNSNNWSGWFRSSPREIPESDGIKLVSIIDDATKNPQVREFDKRKYWRTPKTYNTKAGKVTVPDEKDEPEELVPQKEPDGISHEEIQWLLLKLGSDMGLDVYVAKNDRNKEFNGNKFADIRRIKEDIPVKFGEAVDKTIEHIDVIWLQDNGILAAFEVEHTTSIYSGLLRMADLKSMQPNTYIRLFIVAPDERRGKVLEEVNRPTFSREPISLQKICKFISYSKLKEKIQHYGNDIKYVKFSMIDDTVAESCIIKPD